MLPEPGAFTGINPLEFRKAVLDERFGGDNRPMHSATGVCNEKS